MYQILTEKFLKDMCMNVLYVAVLDCQLKKNIDSFMTNSMSIT